MLTKKQIKANIKFPLIRRQNGLTRRQIKEIREHLEKAQNPIFFFDNDPDGLCSFLLLQRYCEKGKGVAARSFPGMNADYFRKVEELNADYIFIVDKPVVDKEFFDKVKEKNIPVVWIDHHEIDSKTIPKFVNYYNPIYNKKPSNIPVTALCYQISNKKDDLWIAVAGCISDKHVPDFYPDFKKKYPDLSFDSEDAFDIFYKAEIGKVARLFAFALKDRTTNVINMLRFLMKVKTPYEVLNSGSKNKTMHSRFSEIDKKYQKYLSNALDEQTSDKLLFFKYSGDLSISSDLSNELSYKFSDKIIIVVYTRPPKANISGRGEKVREIVLKAIKDLDGATGGGHERAVGAQIKMEDIDKFKKKIVELLKR